jgi:D-glycero-D-manno-heptose 1,7-bisphosphate phosphatase
MADSLRPAVFVDRDGVVNLPPPQLYVTKWEEFHFSNGIIDALSLIKSRGYLLILITNQQGVGKGIMSQTTLDQIHAQMQAELRLYNAEFDAIYACTCLASNPSCTCRKPSPEMVLKAAQTHRVDLKRSWMIGDYDRDIEMAQSAGIPHTLRILLEGTANITATHTLLNTESIPSLLETHLPHLHQA